MSWKSSHAPKIESCMLKELCHGMTEHLKLAGTSGDHLIQHSCSWKAQPEQMDQDCVQLDSGHLQGWRFHDFSKLFLSLPPLSPQRVHTLSFKAPGTASRGTFKEGIWEECWKESWNGLVWKRSTRSNPQELWCCTGIVVSHGTPVTAIEQQNLEQI